MASYGITPLYADALLLPLQGVSTRIPIVCVQLHDGPPGSDGTGSPVEVRQQMTFGGPDSGAVALTGGQPSWEIDTEALVTGASLWSGFEDDTSSYALFTMKANPPVQVEIGDVLILNECDLEWFAAAQGLWTPVGTITPPTMRATARMFAPTVSGGANVTAPLMTARVVGFAPRVVFPAPTMRATARMFAPTVSGGANVTAPLMRATAKGFAPTVSIPVFITAPLMKVTVTGFAPAVHLKTWLATGPGATGATSPVGFTDTIPAGTKTTLIWVAYAATVASPTIGLTLGGSAATLVQTLTWGSANPFYFLSCFEVASPPTGTPEAIAFSCTSLAGCAIDTVHYRSVTTVGTPIALANQSGQPSISAPSSDPNTIYAQAFVYRAAAAANTFSGYSQNQRELVAAVLGTNPPFLIGDAEGTGSTLVFLATRTSTTQPWGGMIVPLT